MYFVACAVWLAAIGRTVAEEGKTYSAKDFFETVTMGGASFSADESKILIYTDETGTFNVYAQPVGGGAREQLTDSDSNATLGVSYFPNDERFLYTADQGGNELNHLYVRLLDGNAKDLTPGENLKARFGGWQHDLSAFYVWTNERSSQAFDLYRYAVDSYDRKLLFENDGSFLDGSISRDGRWLSLNKAISNADSDVYLVDLSTEPLEPRLITEHEGDIEHRSGPFSADGDKLYVFSNRGSEFQAVWAYDLATAKMNRDYVADWDVSDYSFSYDGKYLVRSINADARGEIEVVDLETGKPLDLPALPGGDIGGITISRSGKKMAFYVNSDTSPNNLYIMDLRTGDAKRLSNSLSPKLDESDLVKGEVVRFPSFDRVEIPAILYRPKAASASLQAPAMLWIHGGPGGQSRHGYNPALQHLVNNGYAILAVNNRGSSGYGKTFFHMDDKKHGEVDLDDCVWGKNFLKTLDWIDSDKIGILGGSYGGYMVCAALAFRPETFDCGIDIFGVTNWVRTLESIPPWWGAFKDSLYAELGDPATDGERLRRISPLFHATEIVRPLLVVQGANDPRVLKAESDEIVGAVKANGVPVDYVVFDDEGHGFRNKNNRIKASGAYLKFLDTYLKNGE